MTLDAIKEGGLAADSETFECLANAAVKQARAPTCPCPIRRLPGPAVTPCFYFGLENRRDSELNSCSDSM